MKQQSTEKNGLFYAFGRRGLWRDHLGTEYQPNGTTTTTSPRYGRGGSSWFRAFYVAG
ncbi:hypothetical protein ACIBBE_11540 [Streptomyces sp. NPDC051644]|uniref:hypothetical protein n=1 Tax=Streptomyces sp. NPDC051644 TaxID=3365666 RepID=UPI00378F882F